MHLEALLVAIFLAPVTTLAEAREQFARGEPRDPVPVDVAREAAEAIPSGTSAEDLEELAAIARAGGALPELGLGLARVIEDGGFLRNVAILQLSRLAERPTLSPQGLRTVLDAGLEEDDEVALAAAAVAFPQASPADAVELITEWYVADLSARVTAGLPLLRSVREPLEVTRSLVELGLPAIYGTPLAELLRGLAQDPTVADHLLEVVSSGAAGPQGAYLRALGGVSLADEARWHRASELVVSFLVAADEDMASEAAAPDVLAAAVGAGADLFVPELLRYLPQLAAPGPRPDVRIAALEAVAKVGYRDGPTIDLLIDLLEDPDREVAIQAHATLVRKSGYRAAHRKELWTTWRKRLTLPDAPPLDDAERMAEQRRIRLGRPSE